MRILVSYLCSILFLLVSAPALLAQEDGFMPLFDGKSLSGWEGDPKFWSVQDGVITGQTTPENPTQGNTFLIYQGDEFSDFELQLEYKIIGGNSGIQYRSFLPDPEKSPWVVGGYQGDFEAGDTYSGILYGEKFRGILANRGQKTELTRTDGKFESRVVGSVGESDAIQAKIKKEDWNQYSITADGFHFVHKINGVVTAECTDLDESERRKSGIIALQLHQGPPMTVQFRNVRIRRLDTDKSKKRIVFLAGRPSHGYGSHEHNAGCRLLAGALAEAMPEYEIEVVKFGWDGNDGNDLSSLTGADCVVVYCDGGGRHLLNPVIAPFDKLMDQGVGLVCLHYAVETPKGETGDAFVEWMGGYFETDWSVNPHWEADFADLPDHPITRGVAPFKINDEWYFHMRFREGMEGVTPILSAHPPESTMRRKDGAHSGNPHVRKAVAAGEIQHVAWAAERPGGNRGFGFTGGHFHWNWQDGNFRKTVLNAIVWAARGEIPAEGVTVPDPSEADLKANQDEPEPKNKK